MLLACHRSNTTMAARDSRDKKGVERFVPPEEQQEKGKNAIFEVKP